MPTIKELFKFAQEHAATNEKRHQTLIDSVTKDKSLIWYALYNICDDLLTHLISMQDFANQCIELRNKITSDDLVTYKIAKKCIRYLNLVTKSMRKHCASCEPKVSPVTIKLLHDQIKSHTKYLSETMRHVQVSIIAVQTYYMGIYDIYLKYLKVYRTLLQHTDIAYNSGDLQSDIVLYYKISEKNYNAEGSATIAEM